MEENEEIKASDWKNMNTKKNANQSMDDTRMKEGGWLMGGHQAIHGHLTHLDGSQTMNCHIDSYTPIREMLYDGHTTCTPKHSNKCCIRWDIHCQIWNALYPRMYMSTYTSFITLVQGAYYLPLWWILVLLKLECKVDPRWIM